MHKTVWRNRGAIAGAIALSGLLMCGSQALADEPAPTEVFVPPAPVARPAPEPVCPECDEVNHGRVGFRLAYDIATRYYFRGILQEDKGLINQPWAEVDFDLYRGDGALDNITLTGGLWNSLHSQETGKATKATGPDSWYEADAYAELAFGIFENTTLSANYVAYTSPNGAFATVQEVGFGLGFDDSDLLGALALQPEVLFAIEVAGSVLAPVRGTYVEISGGPETTIGDDGSYPLTLSVPMRLGLSLENYYQDDTGSNPTFGFFDLGLAGAMPLEFLPDAVGNWQAHAGVHFTSLGKTLRAVNRRNNDWDFYGLFGVLMTY